MLEDITLFTYLPVNRICYVNENDALQFQRKGEQRETDAARN